MVSERKRNIDQLYDNKKKMKKMKLKRLKKPKVEKPIRDTENYIPYHSSDKHTEDGLAINSFERQAQSAELSISTNTQEMHYKPGQKKWDRIKKKMVSVENPKAGKIRTESGIWIPATYKTGRYTEWKEKTKTEDMVHQEMGLEGLYNDTILAYGTSESLNFLMVWGFRFKYSFFCSNFQLLSVQTRW